MLYPIEKCSPICCPPDIVFFDHPMMFRVLICICCMDIELYFYYTQAGPSGNPNWGKCRVRWWICYWFADDWLFPEWRLITITVAASPCPVWRRAAIPRIPYSVRCSYKSLFEPETTDLRCSCMLTLESFLSSGLRVQPQCTNGRVTYLYSSQIYAFPASSVPHVWIVGRRNGCAAIDFGTNI